MSKTLNGELGSVFKRWYPDLQLEEAPQAIQSVSRWGAGSKELVAAMTKAER